MHHQPPNQERALNLSILTVSGPGERACFEHSNFFKVNVPATRDTRRRASADGHRQLFVRVPADRAHRARQAQSVRSFGRSVGRSFVRDARSYARPNAAAAAIPFSRPAAAAPRSRARSRMHATTSTTTARPFFHTPFESSVRRPNSQDRQVGIEIHASDSFHETVRSTKLRRRPSADGDPFRNVCRDEHEFAQPKYGNRPMRDRARTETCESAPKAG
ncbi:hypothetical protein NP493_2649g00016, partial [Ridgeia piscesae]